MHNLANPANKLEGGFKVGEAAAFIGCSTHASKSAVRQIFEERINDLIKTSGVEGPLPGSVDITKIPLFSADNFDNALALAQFYYPGASSYYIPSGRYMLSSPVITMSNNKVLMPGDDAKIVGAEPQKYLNKFIASFELWRDFPKAQMSYVEFVRAL